MTHCRAQPVAPSTFKRRRGADFGPGSAAASRCCPLPVGAREVDRFSPGTYNRTRAMDASAFDELEFFRAIARSGVRSLLIGRRALVLLGLPVLTADYDFWIDIEDIVRFNAAAEPFGLRPTRSPDDARRAADTSSRTTSTSMCSSPAPCPRRRRGRGFGALWERRRSLCWPWGLYRDSGIAGLILTKRISARPKDLEDIRLLEVLRREDEL